jgi:hypothetical protein
MDSVTCATCPFGERLSTGATDNMVCHLGRFPDEPRHPATWFCSEHPLAPGQRDRIAEMAMQGMLASESMSIGSTYMPAGLLGRAHLIADIEMTDRARVMAEREKGRK